MDESIPFFYFEPPPPPPSTLRSPPKGVTFHRRPARHLYTPKEGHRGFVGYTLGHPQTTSVSSVTPSDTLRQHRFRRFHPQTPSDTLRQHRFRRFHHDTPSDTIGFVGFTLRHPQTPSDTVGFTMIHPQTPSVSSVSSVFIYNYIHGTAIYI